MHSTFSIHITGTQLRLVICYWSSARQVRRRCVKNRLPLKRRKPCKLMRDSRLSFRYTFSNPSYLAQFTVGMCCVNDSGAFLQVAIGRSQEREMKLKLHEAMKIQKERIQSARQMALENAIATKFSDNLRHHTDNLFVEAGAKQVVKTVNSVCQIAEKVLVHKSQQVYIQVCTHVYV